MHKFHEISHRKITKTIALSLMMLIPIAFSGITLIHDSENITNHDQYAPMTSASYDTWTGVGNNKSVKTYLKNSSSLSGQTDSFNISVDSSPSKIYSGDFNLTFDSQYNTNYTLEDDSPLNYPAGNYTSRDNPGWTGNNNTGTDHLYIDYGFENIQQNDISKALDSNPNDYYQIDSVASGPEYVVNTSYMANFSKVPDFKVENVIGFWYTITYETTEDVRADLYAYNFNDGRYDLFYENQTLIENDKDFEIFIMQNELFEYVDSNNQSKFLLSVNNSAAFGLKIYTLQVLAMTALEKEITANQHVAMEFDLKGNSTLYGFNAWIRTLDPSLPEDVNLTISLYRANETAERTTDDDGVLSASNIVMEPDNLISTRDITNYMGDEYTFFAFNNDESGISNNINVSNYFVVLSTNSTEAYYSITCMPFGRGSGYQGYNDPDTNIDHLFLFSTSAGATGTWEKFFAVSEIYQVDAAPFSINLTRGWIPETDMQISIQGINVASKSLETGIYEDTSGYHWGLGTWTGVFENQTSDFDKEIEVELDWDEEITSTIGFSVDYSATIFALENATSFYNATLNQDAVWTVNYTFNEAKYPNWNFQKFAYLLPTDYQTTALYEPDGTNIIVNLTAGGTDGIYDSYEILNSSIWYLNPGNYTLMCNSTNYIDSDSRLSSYLHYKDYRWETRSFMQGDNVSVRMKVINGTSTTTSVKSGTASCEIYDVDNSIISSNTLTSSSYDSTESSPRALTVYDFNEDNILSQTYTREKGEYNLIFKWQNGDEIGYRRYDIYLTDYSASISGVSVDETNKENVLIGSISKNETLSTSYDLAWFALNETEANYEPQTPYINETINYELQSFDIEIVSVYLNESLFNPGEDVEINVTVKSLNEHFGNNIKFNAQFTQLINEEWIVIEENCSEVFLDTIGTQNDEYTLNWTITIPDDYKGKTAPIRLNPFKLKITPIVEQIEVESLVFDNVFPFVNYTEDQLEGNILGYETEIARSGPSFLLSAPRNASILPGNTTYFMQLYDGKYTSTNQTGIYEFESKLLTDITDLTTVGSVTWGKSFTVSGHLFDEQSNGVVGKVITIQYWNGSQWKDYTESDGSDNQLTTTSDGKFTGEFNSTQVAKGDRIRIRSTWAGDDDYGSSSKSAAIYPTIYSNDVIITIINTTEAPALRKGRLNSLTFKIENTGNSTLCGLKFVFDFDVSHEVSDLNLLNQKQIDPEEAISITYEFNLPRNFNGKNAEFGLNVSGYTMESNESFSDTGAFKMTLLDYSPLENAGQMVITFLLLGIIAFWGLTILYSIKTYRKITEVPEKTTTTKKRRRGRYVDVSELEKEKEEEDEDLKTADLDDLLAEEGLDEEDS